MKLSKKLIEILQLMNNKWQLGRGEDGKYWLQLNGIGRGGKTKWLHGRTQIGKLLNLNFIESCGWSFPTTKYQLTDKGKQYLKTI